MPLNIEPHTLQDTAIRADSLQLLVQNRTDLGHPGLEQDRILRWVSFHYTPVSQQRGSLLEVQAHDALLVSAGWQAEAAAVGQGIHPVLIWSDGVLTSWGIHLSRHLFQGKAHRKRASTLTAGCHTFHPFPEVFEVYGCKQPVAVAHGKF
jgi:hypothetical protein